MSTFIALLIISLLIAGNAFFVALEFALIAADRSKLQAMADDGRWSARVSINILKKLSFHLSGAQLGITVTSLVLGFLTDSLVRDLLNPLFEAVPVLSGDTVSILIALLVATIFQLVAGELIPKNIAIAQPEKVSLVLSPIAQVVNGVLKPFIVVFNGAANWIVRRIGLEPQEELSERLSLKELEYLINTSGDSGVLGPATQDLLRKTIRFGDKTAADALTPRVHVKAISVESSLSELLDSAKECAHSKFPVIDSDLDDVKGVVDVASIFGLSAENRVSFDVSKIMTEPLIIPETKELVDVLKDFESADTPMAIVLDEHGGTAGILTIEDVLEEIVGEIDDEYDEQSHLTLGIQPGTYVLAGTLHSDEVNELCGFDIPEGDYETIAGFVLAQMGRIPFARDHFIYDGWEIEVLEMDGLRIASLQLEKLIPAAIDSDVEND